MAGLEDFDADLPVDEIANLDPSRVTLEHLQSLVRNAVYEGFRLEYKQELGNGDSTLSGICAMANTFGGIILVGIAEDREAGMAFGKPKQDGLVGVEPISRSRLASMCSNRLVLPFDPEIHAVPIGGGRVVLVVRVDEGVAPRPLTFNNRVLVRTEEGNRPADLFRLRSLFYEEHMGSDQFAGVPNASPLGAAPFHDINPANAADFVIRATAAAKVLPKTGHLLLDDRARLAMHDTLMASSITEWLLRMHNDLNPRGTYSEWLVDGLNTSTRSELWWKGFIVDGVFPEARFVADIRSNIPSNIEFRLDIVLRQKMAAAKSSLPPPDGTFRLRLEDLFYLLKDFLELKARALPEIVDALSLASGPIFGPSVGFAINGQSADEVLDVSNLKIQQGLRANFGEPLQVDPTLHLVNEGDRHLQSANWLRQILLDSHFEGVDHIVTDIAG